MSIRHGNFKREIRLSFNEQLEEEEEEKERERRKSSAVPEINVQEPFVPGPDHVEKMAEDERLDFLLRAQHNLTEYFENMAYVPPFGLTAHDYKSVSPSRREGLEQHKMKLRRENYIYMSQHPEVDAMIEILLKKLMTVQPTDPIEYMAEYFCVKHTSMADHKKQIADERNRIARYRKAKSKEFDFHGVDISEDVRKLNLGPFADILRFSKPKDSGPETEPPPEAPKADPSKSEQAAAKPQAYCGCKDWKKNRRKLPPLDPTALPSYGNISQKILQAQTKALEEEKDKLDEAFAAEDEEYQEYDSGAEVDETSRINPSLASMQPPAVNRVQSQRIPLPTAIPNKTVQ